MQTAATPSVAPELADALHHLPATDTAAPACLNCGTPVPDRFCGHCGQAAAVHRLTVGHLLHELPHTVWHVDKGMFYTLRELLLRPGPTILGYLRGQRVRHFAPLSLLLLVTGLASFLAIKLRLVAMTNSLGTGASAELRAAQAHGAESVMHYLGWIYVAMSPVIGLFVRRALRRTGLNLAEAMVAVLYVTAVGNLLSMLLLPAYFWTSTGAAYYTVSLASSLLIIIYQGWAYGQLLHESPLSRFGRWWRGLLTAVAAYVLVMCGAIVLMFSLNWGAFQAAIHKEAQHRKAQAAHAAPAHP